MSGFKFQSFFHSSMDSDSDLNNPVAASAAYGGDKIQHVDKGRRRKNKAYSMHLKLQVIREAKATTRQAAAK